MKAPTQADVARLADVSRATVSFVLSGRTGGPIGVTKETRKRILRAAEELGYEPNAAAQALRLKSNKSIGVTVFDLANPHSWQIVGGADEEARLRDYNLVLLVTAMDVKLEKASVREVLRRRIDGLILAQSFHSELREEFATLAARKSPVVLLGDYPGPQPALDTVTPGHGEGAVAMMQHLTDLGHRRIGFVFGVAQNPLGNERLMAYTDCLRSLGVFDPSLIVPCGVTIAEGYRAAMELLERRPRVTAILAINDLLAIGVLHAAAECGLRVPADLSVAGFDDIDMAAFLNPALTTVRVHAEEIGRAALRRVLERIEQPDCPPQHSRVPAQLVIRDSTGPAPSL
jgi:LacI family transcriptional regulator